MVNEREVGGKDFLKSLAPLGICPSVVVKQDDFTKVRTEELRNRVVFPGSVDFWNNAMLAFITAIFPCLAQ